MKRLIAALALLPLSLAAQTQTRDQNKSNRYFYDGSNNLIYICSSPQTKQIASTFSVAASTLTNISVATNVGTITFSSTSYLWKGAIVTVSGSATSALNATYKITAVSGSTATVTTSGVSDGTYNDSTLVLATSSPLLNETLWTIQAYTYTGTTLDGSYTASSSSGATALACSNRASY